MDRDQSNPSSVASSDDNAFDQALAGQQYQPATFTPTVTIPTYQQDIVFSNQSLAYTSQSLRSPSNQFRVAKPQRNQRLEQQTQRAGSLNITQPRPGAKIRGSSSHRLLLIELTDQYQAEARKIASLVALQHNQDEALRYYELMAKAMSCLETVLKHNWDSKLKPRVEACLQLRFATLLHEECENTPLLETLLSKGISFCESNRLQDNRYAMQHLLLRSMFSISPKPALKMLDNIIKDATAMQHDVWLYAFRFLRVIFAIEDGSRQELNLAVNFLRTIAESAKMRRDNAVLTVATAMESTIHLRMRGAESISEAQRALAIARGQQSAGVTSNIPQLDGMILFADLACTLDPYNQNDSKAKVLALTQFFDQTRNHPAWKTDGSFVVHTNTTTPTHIADDTGGILTRSNNGFIQLTFSWLSSLDGQMLAFMLNAMAVHGKNGVDGHKAEAFLKEASVMLEETNLINTAPKPDSLKVANARVRWQNTLRCHLLLQLAFAYSERAAWTEAKTTFHLLRKRINELEPDFKAVLSVPFQYLEAVMLHGMGHLDKALKTYQSPVLAIPKSQSSSYSPLQESFAILAAFNTLLIIRPPSHPSHHLSASLLASLTTYFPSSINPHHPPAPTPANSNHHLSSAYHLLLTLYPSAPSSNGDQTPLLHAKQHLQAALSHARISTNPALLTFIFNYMHAHFFRQQVSEQAIKSATAARTTAFDAGSALWGCVADGILSETLEYNGDAPGAAKYKAEGLKMKARLPRALQDSLE